MKKIKSFLIELLNNRQVILRLAVNDFKSKYSNSMFGAVWAYVQPLITILVFAIVFQSGYKNPPVKGIPFIIWYIPAYICWMFYVDMLSGCTNVLQEYSFLVKKVKFNVTMLPIIKIVSAFMVHIVFIIFNIVANTIMLHKPTFFYIQGFYYTFALMLLCLGTGWLFSALSVFFKDMIQIVNIIIQVGFWISPILWNYEEMDPIILKFMMINPMYYIINGYRESFLYDIPFWEHPYQTIYFWILTLVLLVIGGYIFVRTKSHFADEL